jgi:prepilin-type N-terminal cleavage/methylation domain-containing protein
MKFKPFQKGFTLIELLVVVAIISLLSSVLLAGIREAREKAQIRAFRQEVQQLVNALELYRADNGVYPYENTSVSLNNYYHQYYQNDTVVSNATSLDVLLGNYLKKLPKRITPSASAALVYTYMTNTNPSSQWKCAGSTRLPPYLIYVSSSDPIVFKAVSDWKIANVNGIDSPTVRCFSLN